MARYGRSGGISVGIGLFFLAITALFMTAFLITMIIVSK